MYTSPPWTNFTKYVVIFLSLAAIGVIIRFASPLIGPLVISALLAFVLTPLVERLAAYQRIRRDSAVLIVYLIFLALLIAVPSIVAPLLINQVLNLSVDLLQVDKEIEKFMSQSFEIAGMSFAPGVQVTQSIQDLLQEFIGQVSTGAVNFLGAVSSNFAWLLVILVATYYFLKDGGALTNWLVSWLPEGYHNDARMFISEMNRIWAVFIRGQLILAFLIAIMTSIGMAAVGLRGAVGVGIVAGVLDVIPSVGPMVGGVIAVLVALIFGSSYLNVSNFVFALIVGAIFLVIQQIENIWLRPHIMGQTLKIHPAVVFIGVIGALVLSGVLAALTIIPLMATAGMLGRYIYEKITQVESPPKEENAE